ncbi:SNF2-related protein [Intestinibacillus massiliensis]|uniref:SNF2-related protein n=1 Tax=Intestinibacillus massiliensis TaxID=1871029 RepID=UPI000B35D353|nr:DEAD/DEAH box helicase [Intestinibacillus massiliensis]
MEFVPHEYQRFCIEKLLTTPAAGLFLDMGLGKTVTTLTAVKELKYYRFQVSKVLVIAPKKVAEATWSKEAEKWDHLKCLRVSTVLGSRAKRERALACPADVYVINRENTEWLVDYYRNSWPFDMTVIDESSSFKDQSTKRWKALKRVRPKIRRIVELTGTPAPNTLIDLWAQVYLLDEGARLGRSIGGFRERYFLPDKRGADRVFTYKPKMGTGQAIQDLIGDICVSMKAEDYLSLPGRVSVNVPVVLDARAQRAYDTMERDMLLEVNEDTITADTAAVLTGKLLQLAGGAVYNGNHQAQLVHTCKVEAFLELVDSLAGQPALVFYQFQHERDRIVSALQKSRLRVRVFGGAQDAEDWNSRQVDILLAHPASTAYGLNLQQGGHHVIWFGPTWSLELYQQANARLHRQGQAEAVIIHHLVVQGSVDVDVMAALDGKADTQEALLESLKARIEKAKGAVK